MSNEELQSEEREVLCSIYDGDEAFKEISTNTFQYKYGEKEGVDSFLLEISWGSNYPSEIPNVNLEMFYNRNIVRKVKDRITETVNEEANNWIGCAMTYTLFEFLKDKLDDLLEDQENEILSKAEADISSLSIENQDNNVEVESKKAPKKETLTKSQKRKAWDRAEGGKSGERPRGWDWIDIVKHLSQTSNSSHSTDTALS